MYIYNFAKFSVSVMLSRINIILFKTAFGIPQMYFDLVMNYNSRITLNLGILQKRSMYPDTLIWHLLF